MKWSFSYNSFVKFLAKKIWEQQHNCVNPNPCYSEVCFKGTALFSQRYAGDPEYDSLNKMAILVNDRLNNTPNIQIE